MHLQEKLLRDGSVLNHKRGKWKSNFRKDSQRHHKGEVCSYGGPRNVRQENRLRVRASHPAVRRTLTMGLGLYPNNVRYPKLKGPQWGPKESRIAQKGDQTRHARDLARYVRPSHRTGGKTDRVIGQVAKRIDVCLHCKGNHRANVL